MVSKQVGDKHRLFNTHKIFVTPIVHDEFKGIRVTPSVYTLPDEVDLFAALMIKAQQKGIAAN